MIVIQDNTIRDGLQQSSIKKDFNTKKKILQEIKNTNIQSVELGMCTTNIDVFQISNYLSILNKNQKGIILTRLLTEDINLVCSMHEKYKNVVIKLLIPISDLHIHTKLNTSKEIYKAKLKRILKFLSSKTIQIDLCLEDFTRADLTFVFEILDMVSKFNITYVTLADTVGCSTPKEYGESFKKITERNYSFKLSAHCHNDLGLATANTLAAIENGAEQIETTFLGIGERTGNAPIEEICMVLQKKYVELFDVSSAKLIYSKSKLISKILEYKIDPMKPILGKMLLFMNLEFIKMAH